MSDKIAVYAGSFDPFTKGHEDVLIKSLNLFDKIIILVCVNPRKTPWLSPIHRLNSISKLIQEKNLTNVEVDILNDGGVAVDYAIDNNAEYLIRGIRTVSDFEYEMSITAMNQILEDKVNTLFFTPNAENQFTSSSMVREFIRIKKYKKVSRLLPKSILDYIIREDLL